MEPNGGRNDDQEETLARSLSLALSSLCHNNNNTVKRKGSVWNEEEERRRERLPEPSGPAVSSSLVCLLVFLRAGSG
jgi:hypothetical protein